MAEPATGVEIENAASRAKPSALNAPLFTLIAGFALLCGLGMGVVFAGGAVGTNEAVLLVGAAIGGALALVAATRFWLVVVALFVVRSSLDALKLSSFAEGSTSLDPGVIVGLVFLLSGAVWTFAQYRSGGWFKLSATSKWFSAVAIASLVAAIASDAPVTSGRVALKICAGALMFVVLEQALRQRPERGRHVLVAGGLSVLVPGVVAFSQLTSPRELEAYLEVSRIQGTFVHPNPFATYLVMAAVMAVAVFPHVRGRARALSVTVAAIGATFTLFTYARGAWIALAMGLLVIGLRQDRRILAGLFVGLIGVVMFVPSFTARLSDLSDAPVEGRGDPNSLSWRLNYWQDLVPLTADNPLTGIGTDQVMATSPDSLQPHNVFVQALVETGIVGLVCILGLCFAVAIDLARAIRRASPGLPRGVAVGAAAVALGVLLQMGSENLLTQAAIHWYLAACVVVAIVWSTNPPSSELAPDDMRRTATVSV